MLSNAGQPAEGRHLHPLPYHRLPFHVHHATTTSNRCIVFAFVTVSLSTPPNPVQLPIKRPSKENVKSTIKCREGLITSTPSPLSSPFYPDQFLNYSVSHAITESLRLLAPINVDSFSAVAKSTSRRLHCPTSIEEGSLLIVIV
ncbi:hypothetical protein FRC03_005947 [Tulasnella sp. 419]|nr:hypothetical protein FRC03_005947 [Tulasnella sp. 419]